MRRLLHRMLPGAREIRGRRPLHRVFGRMLLHADLWRLNRGSVAGAASIGLFMAWMPVPFQMLPAAGAAVAAPAQEQPVPEPYDPAEFAPALHHLRRAEIVAVGAFPFALLLSTLVYDTARWAGAGFAEEWAPFRDSFEDGEKVGIALAAVGVAVAVAVVAVLI